MSNTITFRVPESWAGRLDSAAVRHWLAEFLQRPTPDLPADPGGGEARVTLAVPKRAVKVISGLLDCSESAALRRIIAANVGALPQARPRYALPEPGRAERARVRVEVLPPVSARPERRETAAEGWWAALPAGLSTSGPEPAPAVSSQPAGQSFWARLRDPGTLFMVISLGALVGVCIWAEAQAKRGGADNFDGGDFESGGKGFAGWSPKP